jgi:hypothetical protein
MHFATLIPDWDSLDSVRHAHSDLEAAALAFFALLVLFDILAHLSTDGKKKTLLEKIGLCCFAIAVLAEVVAYPYGQRNDTLSAQVIGSLDAKSGEAEAKAQSALEAAGKAKDKADAASNKLEAIQKRLNSALEQVSDLEHRLRIQGPRWRLLEENRATFIKALKPFDGQRVTVVECGTWGKVGPEPFRLEQDLLEFFRGKWAVESPGYAMWTECTNGATSVGGNLVIVASTASNGVKSAAKALGDILNTIEISTIQTESEPARRQNTLMLLGADSPWELAAKDPTAVILLVGVNPMVDLAGAKKRHK